MPYDNHANGKTMYQLWNKQDGQTTHSKASLNTWKELQEAVKPTLDIENQLYTKITTD